MRRILVGAIAMAVAIAASMAPPLVMAATDTHVSDARHVLQHISKATVDVRDYSVSALDLRATDLHAAARKSRGESSRRAEDAQPVAVLQPSQARIQRSMPLLL